MRTKTVHIRFREANARHIQNRIHRAAQLIKGTSFKARSFNAVKAIRELRESR